VIVFVVFASERAEGAGLVGIIGARGEPIPFWSRTLSKRRNNLIGFTIVESVSSDVVVSLIVVDVEVEEGVGEVEVVEVEVELMLAITLVESVPVKSSSPSDDALSV
jgi:hypothetical protein